jgi:hypothetical protein
MTVTTDYVAIVEHSPLGGVYFIQTTFRNSDLLVFRLAAITLTHAFLCFFLPECSLKVFQIRSQPLFVLKDGR